MLSKNPFLWIEKFEFIKIFVSEPVKTTKPYTHSAYFKVDPLEIKFEMSNLSILGSFFNLKNPEK